MIFRILLKILILFFFISCSSNISKVKDSTEEIQFESSELQYTKAMVLFDNQQYEEAIKIFDNIEKIYPLSNEAIQSQIMLGFIDYILLKYDDSILKFSRIIKKYPTLKNIDYVYYMLALCYYEQISHEELDGKYNQLALEKLNQVINRFPESKYAKDSLQKIILVKSNIAAKHMTIGRFYQKEKKYTAALKRYNIVINSFDETKFVPEALFRVSEIYLSIGMIEESKKIASILGYNYPNSEWYQYIYENLTEKSEGSKFFTSIDKIFNK